LILWSKYNFLPHRHIENIDFFALFSFLNNE
jgi:hypothetical protein